MTRRAKQNTARALGSLAGPPAHTHEAATALVVALTALLVTRAAVAFVPSMALWGLNVQRFLGPGWAWVPWLVAGSCLLPPVARMLLPALEAIGRTIVSRPLVAAVIAGGIAAAIVLAHPDRLYFVGDFLIRLGALRRGESPTVLSPQAFPLDIWLHYTLPLRAQTAGWTDALGAARAIGALSAALLGAAAVLLARSIRVGPAATAAAAAVALFGGYLCLYTGESKAFAEVCVVVVAFAGCAFAALGPAGSERAPAWPWIGAGVSLALGVLLHRFALGLIPAAIVLVMLSLRRRPDRRTAAAALLAMALPAAVIVAMASRIWRTVVTYDLGANFATAEVQAGGGMLSAAFEPSRLLDVLNLVVFLTPMLIVALIVGVIGRRDSGDPETGPMRRDQAWFAATLAIPFSLVFLAARPPQGLVRDWDSFAAPGVALAVWAAWRLAVALDGSRRAWCAVALVAAVTTSSGQWLAHYADEARGLARLEALMLEPPGRPAVDRARTWDFLGWRNFREERYEASARAFEQAVAAAPSARNHTHWAMAETMTGRQDKALEIYLRAAERDSNLVIAWHGVAVSGINTGNRPAVERAAARLRILAPDDPKTQEIVQWLEGSVSQY